MAAAKVARVSTSLMSAGSLGTASSQVSTALSCYAMHVGPNDAAKAVLGSSQTPCGVASLSIRYPPPIGMGHRSKDRDCLLAARNMSAEDTTWWWQTASLS